MLIGQLAIVLEIVLLAALAVFQIAVVAGAPLGAYCWGGKQVGVLPIRLRIASAVSLLLYIAMAGHYASLAGWLPSLLDGQGRQFVLWGLIVFSLLGVLANSFSRSRPERMIFAPVSALLLLGNILILLFQ
ncbi:MAG: hypothetical protein RL670_1074 [Actinomycetota bacterium]|jgi:hypothetical protein